jgi:predicted regulator of Ras-like GTPase activity (Roadblock/LC7/MglB family)
VGELDWLLDSLTSAVAGVRIAVILSPDGLPLARSSGLSDGDADHLASLAAGANSLARGTGHRFGYGEVNHTIIEMEIALLFIMPAGRGTCIALLADASADAGLVAYEMSELVKRLGQHMIANPRFPVPDPVSW